MVYVLGIDQSTQGTKAVLFDEHGGIVKRVDIKHKQWINESGWVSHDIVEIYQNVIRAVRKVVEVSGISKDDIRTVGISNQRETTAAWRKDGTPVDKAIVWQCSRAGEICNQYRDYSDIVLEKTGIPISCLAEVTDSNAVYGYTDFEGYLNNPITIHGVLGDSHAALFGQGCHEKGMIKTTYGTGSSIMMNIGSEFKASKNGLATSLAWSENGNVSYVLEGNINYTGAVIAWLHNDLQLMETPDELETAATKANPENTTVMIPAFSGLGAPHWQNNARAMIYGMSRTTGKHEVLKAAMDSIAYQIQDVLAAMEVDSGTKLEELRVDGGPTKNVYLMQFQSDISNIRVGVPGQEELSAIGAAYMAGIGQGIYRKERLFAHQELIYYRPDMTSDIRERKRYNWKEAIDLIVKN